jgi:hypothetical protein
MLLFSGSPLRNLIEMRRLGLHAEVYQTPDDDLLAADVDAWATALGEAYAVRAPVLNRDEWSIVRHNPQAVVSDQMGRQVDGNEATVRVPFTGEPQVFAFRANEYSLSPAPVAEVRADALYFAVTWPAHHAQFDLRAHMDRQLARVEQALQWSRADCEGHNVGLDGYAKAQIENRTAAVTQSRAVLVASGIPMGAPGGKRNMSEAIRRRPNPRSVPVASTGPAVPLERVLSDEVYEHILFVLATQGETMQRSPATYAGLGEEDLRQALLPGLHSHYVGGVTAEAFSVSGKTDIMVRDGKGAVFIAECKVWSGQAALGPALDQLLSYTTWHDTKLALVVFVRLANLADVVAKAHKALTAHEEVVSLTVADATTLRGSLVFGAEGERGAELAVLFIHLPERS